MENRLLVHGKNVKGNPAFWGGFFDCSRRNEFVGGEINAGRMAASWLAQRGYSAQVFSAKNAIEVGRAKTLGKWLLDIGLRLERVRKKGAIGLRV
jgi:hypothetical protein